MHVRKLCVRVFIYITYCLIRLGRKVSLFYRCHTEIAVSASGGQVVRIDITNLGTVSSILVGETSARILTQDSNFVTVMLPPLGDGIHLIYLNIIGKGYLVTDT